MSQEARSNHWRALLVGVVVAGGAVAFDPGGWQAFGPIKWLVVTGAAWLAGALALRRGVEVHRVSAITWAVFLGWAAITSVTALDPLSAWLGTPDRRMGVVGLATMAVAFVAGQAVDEPTRRRTVGRAVVLGLLAMTAYGTLDAIGSPPIDLTTTSGRLGSTFGSPAYLGAAVCLMLPVTVGLALWPAESAPWRVASVVAAAGGAFLVAGSGTRAALVGLAVGLLVCLPVLTPVIRRRPVVAGAGLVAVVAVMAFSPLGSRLIEGETSGRLAEWGTALDALGQRPLFGTGLEGYRVAFPDHVSVDYVQRYGRQTITDRPHSGPLDLAVSTGVAGGVVWVAAAVWLVGRARRASAGSDPLLAGMAAGVAALFAQELFLFPTLEVGVGGWAIAGMVIVAGDGGRRVGLRGGSLMMAAVAMALIVAGAFDVAADHAAARAVGGNELEAADRALTLRPDSYRYALVVADTALRNGSSRRALAAIETARRLSPEDPAIRMSRARVLVRLVETGDLPAADAVGILTTLVDADPNHPELRLLHGAVLAEAGRPVEAERSWLAAEHLAPADPGPPLRLATLYLAGERRDLAREALERARRADPTHPAIAQLQQALDEQ